MPGPQPPGQTAVAHIGPVQPCWQVHVLGAVQLPLAHAVVQMAVVHVGPVQPLSQGHDGDAVPLHTPVRVAWPEQLVRHARQALVLVTAGWYWPAGQARQAGVAVLLHWPTRRCPAAHICGQETHCDWPAVAWNEPSGHAVHTVAAPADGVKEPGKHARQTGLAVALQRPDRNCPAEHDDVHAVHAVAEPGCDWNDPVGHARHTGVTVALQLPLRSWPDPQLLVQVEQALLPTRGWYCDTVQLRQAVAPMADCASPGAQARQALADDDCGW